MEKNIFHENENKEKARVAILMLDKIHLKTKTITGDQEDHYILKGSIQQEDIILVNIYVLNEEHLNIQRKSWWT